MTAAAAIVQPEPSLTPTLIPSEPTAPPEGGGRLPTEALVGGGVLLLVLGYILVYWRGAAALDRYANGFVIEQCPVCGRGTLEVEVRNDRMLGIPRPRWTVRCSECRSVLRQAGPRRWRYAVDRAENVTLYDRWNGIVIDEEQLKELPQQASSAPAPRPEPRPRPPATPPAFVDDEEKS
jgi:hypothetical protein